PAMETGAAIYTNICADCHGSKGEGKDDEYDEPLTGTRSLAALTKRVKRTMPDDDAGSLSQEDAAAVSAYIYDAFYSPAAQARLHPPEIELARLTIPQYRATIADLLGSFRGGFQNPPDGERGLRAEYSGFEPERADPDREGAKPDSEKKKKDKDRPRSKIDRVDRQVSFAFGEGSPNAATMVADEFKIRWEGSVYAEETGTYDFVLKTENGARLWVNDRRSMLIDAWVSSGPAVREERKSLFLLGGRSYRIEIEFFKYKEKTASIQLLWKPPHGVLEVIPERVLAPESMAPVMVVDNAFPADDRSVGYERGTGVSKAWQEATIKSALAVADHVEANLPDLADAKGDAPDRLERLKNFSRQFAETAFRRPIGGEEARRIDEQFSTAKSPELAVKRVVLFTLESPRFLYPDLGERESPDNYDIASRLALALWDSLPDQELLHAAKEGKLRGREEIMRQATRMLADARTRAKLRGFIDHWLELERADSVAKDPAAFPEFSESVVADLRTSLLMFIDHVLWSERSDYRELLQADYLFLNGNLAKLYGKGDLGAGFEMVKFDPQERAGVITHPYLMTTLAHSRFTSPIHRGVFLTRQVLGFTLKPPPMAIKFEDSKFDPTFTMREKITEMTRDSSCMGCHATINPLGFALEHYDAIGRWRTEDNRKPVDPAGELQTEEGDTMVFHGARDVADFAATSPSGHRAFVRQLFHHMIKQDAGAFGDQTLETLVESFSAHEFNTKTLLTEIASLAASKGLPPSETPKLASQPSEP
ncbi:MAG: DUF1592 domain-containing protein, partial [Chthoniobacteraceae bacterium]